MLIDLVTNPIDRAKEMITDFYFTDTPCDAALLAFNEMFQVAISGEFATVYHPLANKIATIRAVIDINTPD